MILLTPSPVDDKSTPEVAPANPLCAANSDEARLAVKTGDYQFLESLIVYEDDKVTIKFSDDNWRFGESSIKGKSVVNLLFYINEGQGHNVISIGARKAGRSFVNQLKAYALAVIYFSSNVVELATLKARLTYLRRYASVALSYGLNGFESITEETLRDWIADGVDLTMTSAFTGLNSLITHDSFLSFDMLLPQQTHKNLGIEPAEVQQYEVIPFRIWSNMVDTFTKEMLEAYKHRDEIQELAESILKVGEEAQEYLIKRIRTGKREFNGGETKRANVKSFLAALNAEGIPVVDNELNERWLKLFIEHKVVLAANMSKKTVKFQGNTLSYSDARRYVNRLWYVCSWLCMLLSGMRLNELHAMHPEFGAQKIDLPIGQSSLRTEAIYLLTTRQSKITLNSQKANDIYVTSIEGYKAFKVLNALYEPYRHRIQDKTFDTMFVELKRIAVHCQQDRDALGQVLARFASKFAGIDMSLTQADVDNLTVSEGAHSCSVGDQYQVTCHQTRRSLAYYLVGYELCSFPALKQQLGHVSMAMTRWYARNATKYSKFWKEVNDLRTSNKADICVRIFRRLANGERVAGGKGAAYLQQIQNNPNYFEEGVNKQLLSKTYWMEMLRTGKKHLHAIAPSMYCSNDKCSMRLAIDLTECVNCEFDYIENIAYAESARINAMYNIERLIEEGELSASVASSCYMTILASERIMRDLDFKYEPYKVPKEVKGLVINFEVAS